MPEIKPKKSLGQNFLADANIARKIVDSLGITQGDFVIEIGPGEGALTTLLAKLPAKLLAIEIDERACTVMTKKFPGLQHPAFELLNGDFMDFDPAQYYQVNSINGRIKIIGNLPYYISSRIIYKVFENARFFSKAVFMLQKEVADRLASGPGGKEYGILSVAAAFTGKVKKLFDVSPNCFFPKPKVISTVFSIEFKDNPDSHMFAGLMDIVKAAFNQRRKKLRNALAPFLAKNYNISNNEFEMKFGKAIACLLDKRAEELSCDDYISIWEMMNDKYETGF